MKRNILGRGFHWTRSPSGHLIAPMPCLELLLSILLNDLVHCRSFHVYGEYDYEDEDVLDWVGPSDAAAIIFTIIAETALPIKSFHLSFAQFSTPTALDMKRVHIPEVSGTQSSRFKSGWGNLKKLSLDIRLSVELLSLMTGLILSAPHLQKLKLGKTFTCKCDNFESFFDRLSTAEGLPALRELEVYGVWTTGPTLTRFILRFGSTPRKLSFWSVMMDSHDTWDAFFRAMRGNFPLLERISVAFLHNVVPRNANWVNPDSDGIIPDYDWIIFPLLEEDAEALESRGRKLGLNYSFIRRGPVIIGADYSGPGAELALQVLAKSSCLFGSVYTR